MTSTLILGGVRSGKSRFAQTLAERSGLPVVYIATATAGDDEEMAARIARHRESRPATWETVEEPLALARTLSTVSQPRRVVIVDCLTLWLTNLLLQGDRSAAANEIDDVCTLLPSLAGDLLLVSNETGLGVVPPTALSRQFCDTAGELHQRLAVLCERVVFMVAGIPQFVRDDTHADG